MSESGGERGVGRDAKARDAARAINLASAIMLLADTDGNGALSYQELSYFAKWHRAFLTFVRGRWRKYARGNANFVDTRRLESAFARFMEKEPKFAASGERAAQAMLTLIDDDQDGEISLEELAQHHAEFVRFIAWMKVHAEWGRYHREKNRAVDREALARCVEDFVGGRPLDGDEGSIGGGTSG